jgi:hypothetical protein
MTGHFMMADIHSVQSDIAWFQAFLLQTEQNKWEATPTLGLASA